MSRGDPAVDGGEILHQLKMVVYPIVYRVSTIQGDAGFLPSTVVAVMMICDGLSRVSEEKSLVNLCAKTHLNSIHV
jgi:hypothetical protein